MTEALNQARNIARCVDIPITVDADTGYGNVIKVMRATREFEAAGLAKRVVGAAGVLQIGGALLRAIDGDGEESAKRFE